MGLLVQIASMKHKNWETRVHTRHQIVYKLKAKSKANLAIVVFLLRFLPMVETTYSMILDLGDDG